MNKKDLGKIVLHIPARAGSKRVPKKNIRPLNGKPMMGYVVEASVDANITSNIYVNTDSDEIKDYIKQEYPKVNIYLRPAELASDNATSDQFNSDIIEKLRPDTLIMINPVCPLIDSDDIREALEFYQSADCDTLISSSSTKMQTFCNHEPVNINVNEQLAPSQSNTEVNILNWAISIWDAHSFKKRYDNQGYAVLGEKRVFFHLDPFKSIKVSNEEDFKLAEKLLMIK